MRKNNKKKGFTLVELVIVIAVIAILAGVMIATFSNVVEKANASKAFQEAKSRIDAAYIECLTEEKDVKYVIVDGTAVTFTATVPTSGTYFDLSLTENQGEDTAAPTTIYIPVGTVYLVVTADGYSVSDTVPTGDGVKAAVEVSGGSDESST